MNTARLSTGWEPGEPSPTTSGLDVRELEKRTRLMRVVTRRIALSDLSNREIAQRAGVPTQRLSDLLSGKLEYLSTEELETLRHCIED